MITRIITDKAELQRVHTRLSALVRSGRDDLRKLRNLFGLASVDPIGRERVTETEYQNALRHLEDSGY